jgi:CRISPR-associated protein Csb2
VSAPGPAPSAFRPHAAFALRDPHTGEPCAFDLRDAARVAAMLRHAAIRAAQAHGRDARWIEQHVAGHGATPREKAERFSYLVLPCAAPGDGAASARAIGGVLIAGPPAASGADAVWARAALDGAALDPTDRAGPAALLRAIDAADPLAAQALGPARTWTSITPLVLPGHDSRKPRKREALLLRALVQAGCDETPHAALALERTAFAPGVPDAGDSFLPARLRHLPCCHVRIEFRDPVGGPLSLGAGRHAGLGVLTACADVGA